jgi:inosine-uridine nucleoside N-ribohydrolase
VIHCTDIYFPPMDVDDYFDLAALYAIPEINLKAVILDHGRMQQSQPGAIPVSQMNSITGRAVPYAIGLAEKLKDTGDKGLDQPEEYQGGIKLILDTLRQADRPVIIDTVGSLRDVAAAFNREPELFRKKVSKLYIFIGDADESASINYQEYNVSLDPNAYKAIMRSGLPIYWVPCFDGGNGKNNGHASYWTSRYADLLKDASDPTLQYFIHAYRKTASPDQAAFVKQTPDEAAKKQLLEITKDLWAVAVFTSIVDRKFILDGERYRTVPSSAAGKAQPIFGFTEKLVTVRDDTSIVYGPGTEAKRIKCFTILDRAHYAKAMTDASAELMSRLGK